MVHALVCAGAHVRVVDALVPGDGGDRRNLEGVPVELLVADVGDRAGRRSRRRRRRRLQRGRPGQPSRQHERPAARPRSQRPQPPRVPRDPAAGDPDGPAGAHVHPAGLRPPATAPGRRGAIPPRPVDVNGIDKLACEQLHLLYGQVHGLPPTALRLTNVYGPRQRLVRDDLGVPARVLPAGARRASTIELYGDGLQRRDCVHVDDVVDALLAARHGRRRPSARSSTSATPTSSTLRDDRRDHRRGRPAATAGVELVAVAGGAGAHRHRSTSRATTPRPRDLLGWKPTIDLQDGLGRTVAFYREHPWYLSST